MSWQQGNSPYPRQYAHRSDVMGHSGGSGGSTVASDDAVPLGAIGHKREPRRRSRDIPPPPPPPSIGAHSWRKDPQHLEVPARPEKSGAHSFSRDLSPSALDITQPQVVPQVADTEQRFQELSNELVKEREKCMKLEGRAAEAESIAVWLKEELDRSVTGVNDDDLDCTRRVDRREVTRGVVSKPTPQKLPPLKPANDKIFDDKNTDVRAVRDELCNTRHHVEEKQHEVTSLEEQVLKLREDLNNEKQKVIDLKRNANTQVEEFEKIAADVELTQWLQNEVTALRGDAARLRDDLNKANAREEDYRQNILDLKGELEKYSGSLRPHEVDQLISNMSGHLFEVEQELSERTKELSDISDPFLRAALTEMMQMHAICEQLDAAKGKRREPPRLFDPESRDVRMKLRTILEAMHYVVEVIDSEVDSPCSSPKSASGRPRRASVDLSSLPGASRRISRPSFNS